MGSAMDKHHPKNRLFWVLPPEHSQRFYVGTLISLFNQLILCYLLIQVTILLRFAWLIISAS